MFKGRVTAYSPPPRRRRQPAPIQESAVPSITLQNLTNDQLLGMADGLMTAKQYQLAAYIYGLVKETDLSRQNVARIKQGLARNPTSQTPALMSVLRELQASSRNVFVGDSLATWNKTLPFFDDPRFIALSEKHNGLLPLPNWHWNLQTVLWAVQQVRGLEGDLIELGVFRGHTTLFAAEYVAFQTWPKTWRLYDTFAGIPEDQLDPGWEKVNANLYDGTFGFEEVRDRFAHIENIEVIQGRVPEILSSICSEKICFAHIDLNNSTAEIAALEFIFDRIVSGGIIVFDDYCWANARAQHDAEKAWFSAKGLEVLALPTGQGVFVKP